MCHDNNNHIMIMDVCVCVYISVLMTILYIIIFIVCTLKINGKVHTTIIAH